MTLTMSDIALHPGERGTILGMTQSGKSTLAMQLIDNWRNEPGRSFTIIADTKPNFRATHELDGRTTKQSGRYRRDDWGENEVIPNSYVLPMKDPASEIRFAMQMKYDCVIAQIRPYQKDIAHISMVSQAIYHSMGLRKKGQKLYIYVDEMNSFFRDMPRHVGKPIKEAITAGASHHIAVLVGAQRPRNISVEAVESLTKLYWFQFPSADDVKHLEGMGVPPDARPAKVPFRFYFYDRNTGRSMHNCSLRLNNAGSRLPQGGQPAAAGERRPTPSALRAAQQAANPAPRIRR